MGGDKVFPTYLPSSSAWPSRNFSSSQRALLPLSLHLNLSLPPLMSQMPVCPHPPSSHLHPSTHLSQNCLNYHLALPPSRP